MATLRAARGPYGTSGTSSNGGVGANGTGSGSGSNVSSSGGAEYSQRSSASSSSDVGGRWRAAARQHHHVPRNVGESDQEDDDDGTNPDGVVDLYGKSSSGGSSGPSTARHPQAPRSSAREDEEEEEMNDYARLMARLDVGADGSSAAATGLEEDEMRQASSLPDHGGVPMRIHSSNSNSGSGGGPRRPSTSQGRLNGRPRQLSSDSGLSATYSDSQTMRLGPSSGAVSGPPQYSQHRPGSSSRGSSGRLAGGNGSGSGAAAITNYGNGGSGYGAYERDGGNESDGTDGSSMSLRDRRIAARSRRALQAGEDLPPELSGNLANISTARPPPRSRPAKNPARQSIGAMGGGGSQPRSRTTSASDHAPPQPQQQQQETENERRRRQWAEEQQRLRADEVRQQRNSEGERERTRARDALLRNEPAPSQHGYLSQPPQQQQARSSRAREGSMDEIDSTRADLRRAFDAVSDELHHTHLLENSNRRHQQPPPAPAPQQSNRAYAQLANRSQQPVAAQPDPYASDAYHSTPPPQQPAPRPPPPPPIVTAPAPSVVHHPWEDTLDVAPGESEPPLPSYESVIAQQRYQEQLAQQRSQQAAQAPPPPPPQLQAPAPSYYPAPPSTQQQPSDGFYNPSDRRANSSQGGRSRAGSVSNSYSAHEDESEILGGSSRYDNVSREQIVPPGDSVENLHDSPYNGRGGPGGGIRSYQRGQDGGGAAAAAPGTGAGAGRPAYGTDSGWQNYLHSNSSQESATSSLRMQPGIPGRPPNDQRNSNVSTSHLSRIMPQPQPPSRSGSGSFLPPVRPGTSNSNYSGRTPSSPVSAPERPDYPRTNSSSNAVPVRNGARSNTGGPSLGRPASPGAVSMAASSRWEGEQGGYTMNEPWGTLKEEDIEFEEINEGQQQLSLFGIRRRLVVLYPQLGTRNLTSPWQTLETTHDEDGEELPQEILMNEKDMRKHEEKLESREKDLTIEACSKQEMATVTVTVYTEQRDGKWTIRRSVEPDGEEIALEPPGAMDPWSVPIDSKGILRRKKLKSNVELTATRLNVRCPECARTTRLDLHCSACQGTLVVEMSYVVTCTLRVASFLPLKLPSLHLAGARQAHIKYGDAAEPEHRSSVLRDRAMDGAQSAAQRVGRQHFQQHGARLLMARARVERRGVLSIAVTSSKTKVRRTFDVTDGPQGKITDTTEFSVGPAERSSKSFNSGRPSGSSTFRGVESRGSQEVLSSSNQSLYGGHAPSTYASSTYATSTSGFSMSSKSSKAKAVFKGMFSSR